MFNSRAVEPYSRRQSALAAMAWGVGFSAIGVSLSTLIGEGSSFVSVASVIVGVCGALVHATLLRAPRFRRLGGSRVILVAVATLGVASIPIAWSGASAPFDLGEFIRGLIDAAAFFVFPVLVAAFAITMGIERAGT